MKGDWPPPEEDWRWQGQCPAGRALLIQVSDTGSGVAEADRDLMFRPFFTTKQTGRELGLVAPAVVDAAEQHKGAVGYHPAAGGGSVFTYASVGHVG